MKKKIIKMKIKIKCFISFFLFVEYMTIIIRIFIACRSKI